MVVSFSSTCRGSDSLPRFVMNTDYKSKQMSDLMFRIEQGFTELRLSVQSSIYTREGLSIET